MSDGNGIIKAMPAGANAAAGEIVNLLLKPDKAERTVITPPELEAALRESPAAAAAYAALAYSHRREYAVWIEGAKKPETRAARAQKAVLMVIEGKPAR
jgi:uncharacterized protein YdeI (YjbR/CyaY-like superfamily)